MAGNTMQGGGYSERAARLGVGLEVANAIRDYLDKAGGDSRLALALAVADALGNAQGFRRSGDRINAC